MGSLGRGTLIDDLIACAAGILSGELVGKPQETRFGECLLAELGSAGIMYKADKIHWRFPWMQGERIVSPEVHADRTVTFRVKAPKADRVLLTSAPLMNALGSADTPWPSRTRMPPACGRSPSARCRLTSMTIPLSSTAWRLPTATTRP